MTTMRRGVRVGSRMRPDFLPSPAERVAVTPTYDATGHTENTIYYVCFGMRVVRQPMLRIWR